MDSRLNDATLRGPGEGFDTMTTAHMLNCLNEPSNKQQAGWLAALFSGRSDRYGPHSADIESEYLAHGTYVHAAAARTPPAARANPGNIAYA